MIVAERIREDVLVAFERDPAARSVLEVSLFYPGIHALWAHRVAHSLWTRKFRLTARFLAGVARFITGVEIHPGATIGRRCFIDHGMGVVIGETAILGNDVLLYQGVSLGGTTLKKGKRHPTIEDYVVLGLGATVLGPVTVGRHSRVGAGSVVVSSVPPHSTVVGVPGRIVSEAGEHSSGGKPLLSLEHGALPDPVVRALSELRERVARLEGGEGGADDAAGVADDATPASAAASDAGVTPATSAARKSGSDDSTGG
ncbi:MAG: serine O-acetyltransferase [Deltaproteobacteria bacterium]